MGANEKHEATYHGTTYTPTTEQVRKHWENVGFAGTGEEFDRWLNQIRAEAWEEGFQAGWEEHENPGAFVNDYWDAKTLNPYKENHE